MKLRKVIFWLHLLTGTMAGSVILVMAVSGALLAFEPQIVEWSERELSRGPGAARPTRSGSIHRHDRRRSAPRAARGPAHPGDGARRATIERPGRLRPRGRAVASIPIRAPRSARARRSPTRSTSSRTGTAGSARARSAGPSPACATSRSWGWRSAASTSGGRARRGRPRSSAVARAEPDLRGRARDFNWHKLDRHLVRSGADRDHAHWRRHVLSVGERSAAIGSPVTSRRRRPVVRAPARRASRRPGRRNLARGSGAGGAAGARLGRDHLAPAAASGRADRGDRAGAAGRGIRRRAPS